MYRRNQIIEYNIQPSWLKIAKFFCCWIIRAVRIDPGLAQPLHPGIGNLFLISLVFVFARQPSLFRQLVSSYLVPTGPFCYSYFSLRGLARYSVHTNATWDQFWNITQKVWNYPDGVLLVSPWLIESRSYKKSSMEHHTSCITHHTSHIA